MTLKQLSPKQAEILRWILTDDYALICDGAVRSGKTSIMSMAFLIWAMSTYDRTNFAICGKTTQSVERNVLKPLMDVEGLPFTLNYKVSTRVLTVQCGRKLNYFYLFGGKDESSYMLIQGITLAGVMFDEVALMPESFVQQALARCISYEHPKYFFNCNPESPNHFFYKEWIENPKPGTKHIHFSLEDNPANSKAAIERTKQDYSGVFYDRYILGLWVKAEGLVYPMFSDANIIHGDPKGPGLRYISVDYGTKNPTAMGLWRVWQGKAIMMREYYYDGRATNAPKTDEEYYQDLVEFAEKEQIERVIVDPSAASFIECIHRHGDFSAWGADNAVLDGIRRTATMLRTGRLLFHESCENTFKEFGLYSWDENAPEDKVIKENDHSLDQTRYLVSTVMWREM